MNDFMKEITTTPRLCLICNSKLCDTAVVFWNKEMTKIIETKASCSNPTCNYVLVIKDE